MGTILYPHHIATAHESASAQIRFLVKVPCPHLVASGAPVRCVRSPSLWHQMLSRGRSGTQHIVGCFVPVIALFKVISGLHTPGRAVALTLGEITGRDLLGVVGKVRERGILLALSDQEMHNDQGFEHNCPRGVAKSMLKGPEYLCDTRLASMGRHQDRFNVFGFRGRKLCANECQYL